MYKFVKCIILSLTFIKLKLVLVYIYNKTLNFAANKISFTLKKNKFMKKNVFPVRRLTVAEHDKFNLSSFPNFAASGSVAGIKKLFYGQSAKLVKCGKYIYNVTSAPEIYDAAK